MRDIDISPDPYFVVQNGEKTQSPGEFDCPPGWTWEDDWSFDSNRAVDEKGKVNFKHINTTLFSPFFNPASPTWCVWLLVSF